jgi:hypothetical protein
MEGATKLRKTLAPKLLVLNSLYFADAYDCTVGYNDFNNLGALTP